MASGHPLGLFRSQPDNPRVIITNGLLVGVYDNEDDWEVAAQMGVSSYGQMTAGGWMYIGPQGIVHGTYNTLLNAGRLKCQASQDGDLKGILFVSSGLGRHERRTAQGCGRLPVRFPSWPRSMPPGSRPGSIRAGCKKCLPTSSRSLTGPLQPVKAKDAAFHRFLRQCGGSAGICRCGKRADRSAVRSDFLSCGPWRRILSLRG